MATSDSLNYRGVALLHPKYKYTRVLPTSGSSTTLDGSNSEITFDISSRVINLSRSVLTFTMTIPAPGVDRFNWVYETMSAISRIRFSTEGGQDLVSLNYLSEYLYTVLPREMKMSNFLTNDATDRLYPSNSLVAANPKSVGGAGDVNYVEPRYLAVGGNNTATTVQVRFPLKYIVNTLFGIDKDLYFKETMKLHLTLASTDRVFFTSADAADPTDTPQNPNVAVPITNMNLYLAVESDEDVAKMVQGIVNGQGLHVPFPYVAEKLESSQLGSTQVASVTLSKQNGGTRLQKVYYSAFGNDLKTNRAYDNSNVAGVRVTSFQTKLDDQPLTEFEVRVTDGMDFALQKEYLEGSVLANRSVFQSRWSWVDDFSQLQKNNGEDHLSVPKENLLSGKPLDVQKIYSVESQVAGGAQLRHYLWCVCQRTLSSTKDGVKYLV